MSLNTTPRTWVAGEIVSAAEMNTEVRDAITGIQAVWTTYTPSWTGATTNPVIGNGVIVGRYLQVGKTIDGLIFVTMGTTTTFGSGQWIITAPVTARAVNRQGALISMAIGGLGYSGHAVMAIATNTFFFDTWATTAGAQNRAVTSAVPAAWTAVSTNSFTLEFHYEAA